MKIQVGHLRKYDFEKELYDPLRQSELWQKHQFLLPHIEGQKPPKSEETLKNMDVFLVEVSYPSTGLGIEIGFAHHSAGLVPGLAQGRHQYCHQQGNNGNDDQ